MRAELVNARLPFDKLGAIADVGSRRPTHVVLSAYRNRHPNLTPMADGSAFAARSNSPSPAPPPAATEDVADITLLPPSWCRRVTVWIRGPGANLIPRDQRSSPHGI